MYGLTGERRLDEWQMECLSGFDGARPVRIGNAAAQQRQLDIYSEIIDALYQGHRCQVPVDHEGWAMQRKLLEHLEGIWQGPDNGIWEVRNCRRDYTHSKVMVWVAYDRAIRSAIRFGLDGPVERWRAMQKSVKDEVVKVMTNQLAPLRNLLVQRSSTPVFYLCRSSASCRRVTSGCDRRLLRSSTN